MRDPARIDPTLAAIKAVWEKYPDLRLGQLLGQAVNLTFENTGGLTDASLSRALLTIEESALLANLEKLEQKFSRIYARQEA